ncbi:hypothetical protein KCU71_g138, partial [Aureobasidium melanogenum]
MQFFPQLLLPVSLIFVAKSIATREAAWRFCSIISSLVTELFEVGRMIWCFEHYCVAELLPRYRAASVIAELRHSEFESGFCFLLARDFLVIARGLIRTSNSAASQRSSRRRRALVTDGLWARIRTDSLVQSPGYLMSSRSLAESLSDRCSSGFSSRIDKVSFRFLETIFSNSALTGLEGVTELEEV